MKKILYSIPLLSLFVLASCETYTRYGVYSFTMGRSGAGETRVGLTINLTNEKEYLREKELGEKFKMTLEVSTPSNKNYDINGYYNLVDYNGKTRVKLNAQFSVGEDEEKITIPSELLQYIAVTYLSKDAFTFKMPVSMPINIFDPSDFSISKFIDNDLLHQLTWYGFFFDLDTPNLYWDLRKTNYDPNAETYDRNHLLPNDIPDEKSIIKISDSIEKRLGTHPVVDKEKQVDEVTYMNTTFRDIFSRARLYQQENNGKYKLIGSIVQTAVGQTYQYQFEPLNGFIIPASQSETRSFKCYIKDDFFGETKSEILLTLTGNTNVASFKDPEGKREWDVSAEEYFNNSQSYQFRDYHEIEIALKKD